MIDGLKGGLTNPPNQIVRILNAKPVLNDEGRQMTAFDPRWGEVLVRANR